MAHARGACQLGELLDLLSTAEEHPMPVAVERAQPREWGTVIRPACAPGRVDPAQRRDHRRPGCSRILETLATAAPYRPPSLALHKVPRSFHKVMYRRDLGVRRELVVEITETAGSPGRVQALGQVDRLHAQRSSGVQVTLLARPGKRIGQIRDIDLPLPDK